MATQTPITAASDRELVRLAVQWGLPIPTIKRLLWLVYLIASGRVDVREGLP